MFQQRTPYALSPPWKVILLSDGSVTRHLQLMTDQRVEARSRPPAWLLLLLEAAAQACCARRLLEAAA